MNRVSRWTHLGPCHGLSALIFQWMPVKGWKKTPFSTRWDVNHSQVCQWRSHTHTQAHELPCKYPRFTRFMTSLAVRFETSSTSQKGGNRDRAIESGRRGRKKEEEEERGEGQGEKSGRQRMHLHFQKELCFLRKKWRGESDAKKPCVPCAHRITSKWFIGHMTWSCRGNPHWHSRRSWAFGVLPATYSIDTVTLLQVRLRKRKTKTQKTKTKQQHLEQWFCFWGGGEAWSREERRNSRETKKKGGEVSERRVAKGLQGSAAAAAPASPCTTCVSAVGRWRGATSVNGRWCPNKRPDLAGGERWGVEM